MPEGFVVVIAAGFGGDGVILHGESEVRPMHRPVLFLQLRERVVRMKFMQHVPVDINKIAAIGTPADQMEVPDLVEQGVRHGAPAR